MRDKDHLLKVCLSTIERSIEMSKHARDSEMMRELYRQQECIIASLLRCRGIIKEMDKDTEDSK